MNSVSSPIKIFPGFFWRGVFFRRKSSLAKQSLDSSKLTITPCNPSELKCKPTVNELAFGKTFADHMLRVRWTQADGWETPHISPLKSFSIHPASKVLHYAQEVFEGMKAFRGDDDKIRLFRPMHNMARMNVSAKRSQLPMFDGAELLNCIRRLVEIEQEWVPHFPGCSLYIRPTLIGTEPTLGINPSNEAELYVLLCPVGPYFKSGLKGVNLLADGRYVRSFPGGCGFAKMGCNYAPTLWTQKIAGKYNCEQNLWLYGEDEQITECGAMNVFIFLRNENGEKELVTPSLDKGLILPGITRRSIVELAHEKWSGEFKMSERKITMGELFSASNEGRLIEVFGAGTAAIVCPINGIVYKNKLIKLPSTEEAISERVRSELADIFYGRINHPWAVDIESWDFEPYPQVEDFQISDALMHV